MEVCTNLVYGDIRRYILSACFTAQFWSIDCLLQLSLRICYAFFAFFRSQYQSS